MDKIILTKEKTTMKTVRQVTILDIIEKNEIETQEVSTIEPPTEPKYIKDTNATYVTYSDQQKSVSKAKEGHIIQSYRLEYTGNVLTNRVELYRDVYEAQPERIYVGVKSR